MGGKKKLIAVGCITFVAGFVAAVSAMMLFNIGIGDKVFVSQKDYDELKTTAERYKSVNELYVFLKDNFYKPLDEKAVQEGLYKGLFSGSGDPYTRYLTKEEYEKLIETYSGTFDGIGVVMSVTDDNYIEVISVVDDSPAQKAGIKSGDLLVAVNGNKYNGDNFNQAVLAIRGKRGSTVEIVVSRNGSLKEYKLTRSPISDISVTSEIRDDGTGYIRISSFTQNTASQFKDALTEIEKSDAKGLIIDLRNNGGGLVDESLKIADMLMDEGTIVYMEDGKGKRTYHNAEDGRTKLKYVILVNGGSASASEILTAGVQGNREGVIIGTQTYGKGITQNTWKLKSGAGIEITTAQYFGPEGVVIHEKGITPDKVVELKDSDVRDGVIVHDSQLEAAVEELLGKNNE